MSRQEMYSAALLSRVANALRGEKEEPFQVGWPWPDEDRAPEITDEERATYKAQLKARSAFAQVRASKVSPSE